jgi:hypothetical protein
MHGTKLSVIPAAGKAAQSPRAPQLGMSKNSNHNRSEAEIAGLETFTFTGK